MNLPVLVAGAVVLVAGLIALALRRSRLAYVAIGLAVLVGLAAFIDPSADEPPRPSVSIVEPAAGATVPAGEDVTVRGRVTGATIATGPEDRSGGHLHLYLDRELRQMPYSDTATVRLDPGPHEIRIEYVDNRHVSYTPPVDATVEITAG